MTFFERQRLETAFVPRAVPTFAECIARIETDDTLAVQRRRDLISGLRRLAKLLGLDPGSTPADPAWLRPRIQAFSAVGADVDPKTWANIRSNVSAALTICGIVEKPIRLNDLSPLWAPLWRIILDSGNLRVSRALGRFVGFADNLQIAPEDVSLVHMEGYRAALEINELHKTPEDSMRQAIRAWKVAIEKVSGFPGKPIYIARRGNLYALPMEAFPASFREDALRYRRRLEAPDLLDPKALAEPQRPATVKHRTEQLRRFASAVVHAGVPIDALTSTTELLRPDRVRAGLEWPDRA